ncbi:MAG: SHOCT domain-containing protein [Actinobacteria bacterium]|nr:SHOCT domain-containing protein [Actinomycetota bacterium]
MRDRDIFTIAGVVVLVVLLFGFLGGGMMGFGFGPGMMGGFYGGYGFAPWWGIVMLLFWALVIGGAVILVGRLVRQGEPTSQGGARENSGLEILRQRYARGEISKEQFDQMRRDLE